MRLSTAGERVKDERLARYVKECVGALGLSPRAVSAFYQGPMAKAYQGVTFYEKDLGLTQTELSDRVLEEVTKAAREFRHELRRRSADPEVGFSTTPAMDLSGKPGWAADMPRYAVWLKWYGPMPTFWPHPVTAKDLALPTDLPSDAEFKQIHGETPEKMMKRTRAARRPRAKTK